MYPKQVDKTDEMQTIEADQNTSEKTRNIDGKEVCEVDEVPETIKTTSSHALGVKGIFF